MNVIESLDVIISTHTSFSSCERVTHISLRTFRSVSKFRVTITIEREKYIENMARIALFSSRRRKV